MKLSSPEMRNVLSAARWGQVDLSLLDGDRSQLYVFFKRRQRPRTLATVLRTDELFARAYGAGEEAELHVEAQLDALLLLLSEDQRALIRQGKADIRVFDRQPERSEIPHGYEECMMSMPISAPLAPTTFAIS